MAEIYNNLIGGEWVPGADPIANINPSDVTDTIGLYAQATAAQLDHAVAVAKDAQREWQKTGLEQRQQVLVVVGRELMDRS